jgi:8-oxo-dGTP diphosphatase
MIEKRKRHQQILVGGFIVMDQKILLLRRAPGVHFLPDIWEVPSGKVEHGETLREALVREIREETGLEVRIGRVCSVREYTTTSDAMTIYCVQINFACLLHLGVPDINLSREHSEWTWIDVRSSGHGLVSSEFEKAWREALPDLGPPLGVEGGQ